MYRFIHYDDDGDDENDDDEDNDDGNEPNVASRTTPLHFHI